MTSESVAVVRRFNESWNSRDLDGALDCTHADMEFDWSDSIGPLRGIYRGREGVARFWSETWDAWETFELEVEEVIDHGPNRFVTPTTVRGRGKGSGVEVEARGAMLWTLREGKIFKGRFFQTTEEALKAVASPD
jgi:ketosteroid isomerase-like protein